jgi:GNAT superfamily N-acetyltransferase
VYNYSPPRKIKKDELGKLLELYKFLNPEDKNIINEDLLKSWEEILSNDNYFRYYIIESDNKFIASCAVSVIPNLTREGKSYAVIENVITHPDHRRKGLGGIIIKEAVKYTEEKNCYKVMLLSNAKREEAHEFYTSLGFDRNKKIGFVMDL